MPVTPTYPGVYIEEIPSGVRTISGVATSIAAFAGWAPKGPADEAALVLSWADFERSYGGLDASSYLGYSVYHFFANGGQQAYIVRLVGAGSANATVTLDEVLTLEAKNPGEWANDYGVAIKQRTDDPSRFRLSVVFFESDGSESTLESFENLSMDPADSRSVATVVSSGSQIINATVEDSSPTPPDDTGSPSPHLAGELTVLCSPLTPPPSKLRS